MIVFRVLAIAIALAFAASPTLADDAKLAAALKTIADTGNDPKMLGAYCEMTGLMASSESDAAKVEDVDAKIEGLLKTLGPGFMAAMDLEDQLAQDSADGKSYRQAVDALDAKCPK